MNAFSYSTFAGIDKDRVEELVLYSAKLLTEITWPWLLLFLVTSGYLTSLTSVHLFGPKAPLVGIYSIFEPRIIGNWRFFKNSGKIIEEGYSKVCYPHPFARTPPCLGYHELEKLT
jgi:hypothetical protein